MKKLISLGIALMSLGVIILICILSLNNFDITSLSTIKPYKEITYSVSDNDQDIYLQNNIDILLDESYDNQIHFIYYENQQDFYNIESIDFDNKLIINKEHNYNWLEVFNFDFSKISFKILLPKKYNGNLNLINKSHPISCKNITANSLAINSYASNICLQNTNIENDLVINNSYGKTLIDNINSKNIIATGNNLSTNISNTNIVNNLNIESHMADLLLDNISTTNFFTSLNNGSVVFYNLDAEKEISLINNYGKISGTIADSVNNYTINSRVKYGQINLPMDKTFGSKWFYIQTIGGNVDIQFSK